MIDTTEFFKDYKPEKATGELPDIKRELEQCKLDRDRLQEQARALAEEVERLAELITLAEEAADELEAYSMDKYPLDQHHFPSIKRGYDSDMLVVNRIRKITATEDQPQ